MLLALVNAHRIGCPRIKLNFSLVENRISLRGILILDLGRAFVWGIFVNMFIPGRFNSLISLKKDE